MFSYCSQSSPTLAVGLLCEHDSGVSRLLLRSKTLNGPANVTVYEIRVNSNYVYETAESRQK